MAIPPDVTGHATVAAVVVSIEFSARVVDRLPEIRQAILRAVRSL
jgi:hypothetical protein